MFESMPKAVSAFLMTLHAMSQLAYLTDQSTTQSSYFYV